MGKYIKGDFSNANTSINNLKNIVQSIDSIESDLSNYIYNIIARTKLEGPAVCLIAGRLESFRSELVKLSKNISSFCESASSTNSSIIGAFENYTEVSSDKITELKDKIDRINNNIANATRGLYSAFNTDKGENGNMVGYWNYLLKEYRMELEVVIEEYNELKRVYYNVQGIDLGSSF